MPTTQRKDLLKVYIACLKRAEKRIIRAHNVVTGAGYDPSFTPASGQRFLHIVDAIRASGHEPYAMALLHLRIKRSRLTAELEGLEW